jgi:hypothetical protein
MESRRIPRRIGRTSLGFLDGPSQQCLGTIISRNKTCPNSGTYGFDTEKTDKVRDGTTRLGSGEETQTVGGSTIL